MAIRINKEGAMSRAESIVLSIEPSEAQLLLKNRVHQRKISTLTVSKYARDMVAGRWRLSAGAPLALWEDTAGQWGLPGEIYVLNGQHRLLAVIEANIPVEFYVVYETDPDVFRTYDTGLVRTTAALIGLNRSNQDMEAGNATAIGALATFAVRYELGTKGIWHSSQTTSNQIVEWVDQQNWWMLTAAVHDYYSLRRQTTKLQYWYASLSFLVRKHSADSSRWLEFHEPIVHGAGLHQGDPRLTFRNLLLRQQVTKSDIWMRQSLFAMGTKSWNSFLKGEKREMLTFKRIELDKSGMPKIL